MTYATSQQLQLDRILREHRQRIRNLEALNPTRGLLQTYSFAGTRVVANGNMRWTPLFSGSISYVQVSLGTAPTGAAFIVRLKKNGVSVGTVSIPVTLRTAMFIPSPATFTGKTDGTGDFFTVDVTQVGSGVAGADLVVQFWGCFQG